MSRRDEKNRREEWMKNPMQRMVKKNCCKKRTRRMEKWMQRTDMKTLEKNGCKKWMMQRTDAKNGRKEWMRTMDAKNG